MATQEVKKMIYKTLKHHFRTVWILGWGKLKTQAKARTIVKRLVELNEKKEKDNSLLQRYSDWVVRPEIVTNNEEEAKAALILFEGYQKALEARRGVASGC